MADRFKTNNIEKIFDLTNPSNMDLSFLLSVNGLYDFVVSHQLINCGYQKKCYTDGITVWKIIDYQHNRYLTSLFEDIAEIIWSEHIFKNELEILGCDKNYLILSQPYIEKIQIKNFQESISKKMSELGFYETQSLVDKIYLEGDSIENEISKLKVWKRKDGFLVSDLKQENVTLVNNNIFIYDCSVIRLGFREDGKIF